MARNFSCGNTVIVCGLDFEVFDDGLLPNGATADIWEAVPEFCTAWGPGQCSTEYPTDGGSADFSWTIGATTIIEASSSGQLTSSAPMVTGVSPGSGTGYVSVEGGSCTADGSGPGDVVNVPTNFKISFAQDVGKGDLRFTETWQSSSGKLADLSACSVGETVTYNASKANPYPWPAPFPAIAPPNPTTGSASATLGVGTDDHDLEGNTTFVQPFKNATLLATQNYWYSCSNYQSGAHQNLLGPLTITRQVEPDDSSKWMFTVSVTGVTTTAEIDPIE
jgi:hypothetical protein